MTTAAPCATLAGPGGWILDAVGAVIHPAARTVVVADVHLGYEWARGRGGDCLPAHSLAETLAKLGRVLDRAGTSLDRLVVAGDLVESPRPCRRTQSDVATLRRWLCDRGLALVPLPGNHDPADPPASPATLDVAGWTVAHGHRPIAAARTITGHHHPVLRAGGVSAPCFLVAPSAIVLPAFSPNAAGVGLAAPGLASAPDGTPYRCIAAADGELLDFGPVVGLLRALRR
jgi:metallophosphoesterase superfamily enzyme